MDNTVVIKIAKTIYTARINHGDFVEVKRFYVDEGVRYWLDNDEPLDNEMEAK